MDIVRIYVASSWRNKYQSQAVKDLRDVGESVYDFKEPREGVSGFSWSDIDEDWRNWSLSEYINGMKHYLAEDGYGQDEDAMCGCDACILVLPCGRSAHLEAGWFVGMSLPTVAIIPSGEMIEPELMYKMFSGITYNVDDALKMLRRRGCV